MLIQSVIGKEIRQAINARFNTAIVVMKDKSKSIVVYNKPSTALVPYQEKPLLTNLLDIGKKKKSVEGLSLLEVITKLNEPELDSVNKNALEFESALSSLKYRQIKSEIEENILHWDSSMGAVVLRYGFYLVAYNGIVKLRYVKSNKSIIVGFDEMPVYDKIELGTFISQFKHTDKLEQQAKYMVLGINIYMEDRNVAIGS